MKSRPWAIRPATSQDVPTIVNFNLALANETEDHPLDHDTVARGVTRGLQQGDEVQYILAVLDSDASKDHSEDKIVGQLMLTREWSDWRDGWVAWIQSVYVHQDHRGKGVFRSLLDHASEICQSQEDIVGLRLYVETSNQVAQNVYDKSGFTDPKYKVLEQMFS